MYKVISFVLLTAALAGCSMTPRPEDGLQPSAFIGMHTSRCERDARVGSSSVGPSFPTPGSTPRGDYAVARDINRNVYYSCTKEMQ